MRKLSLASLSTQGLQLVRRSSESRARCWLLMGLAGLATTTRPARALGDERDLLADDRSASATEEPTPTGGSRDILVVQASDARIVAISGRALLEIVLEESVYQVFWDGVMNGTFQYLLINNRRFLVAYSPTSHQIYAYDWLGLQYLVSSRPSPESALP